TGNYPDAGGGVRSTADTTLNVGNTIIAGNGAFVGGGADVFGAFTSQGYNLIGNGDGSSGFTSPGDQVGNGDAVLNPQLSALANNGGLTDTMALLAGSPAIDQGNGFGLTTDQRGQKRPFDQPGIPNATAGGSDIGAYERQAPQLLISDATVTEGNSG